MPTTAKNSSNDVKNVHPYLRGMHNDPDLIKPKINRTLNKSGVVISVEVLLDERVIWKSA